MNLMKIEQQQTMTTKEIAELTNKEHRNILADTRKMLEELHGEGGMLSFQQTYLNEQNGQEYPMFALPKRETLVLVSGYSITMRAKIIDRWQELEVAATPVPSLKSQARDTLQDLLIVSQMFKIPEHIAQSEAVKEVKLQHNVDYSNLLKIAPAQQDIKEVEKMLEPTELGELYGLSARAVNSKLELAGLQFKEDANWVATHKANGKQIIHHWTKAGKSGYNLKWNVKFVEEFLK